MSKTLKIKIVITAYYEIDDPSLIAEIAENVDTALDTLRSLGAAEAYWDFDVKERAQTKRRSSNLRSK